MVKQLQTQKLIVLFFLLISSSADLLAVDRTFNSSGASGLWTDASNWSPLGVPASSDKVIIAAGKYCIVNVAVTRSADLEVPATGKIGFTLGLTQNTPGAINIAPGGEVDVSSVTTSFSGGVNVSGILKVNATSTLLFSSCPAGSNIPLLSQTQIGTLQLIVLTNLSLAQSLTVTNLIQNTAGCILNVGPNRLTINNQTGSGIFTYAPGPAGSILEYVGLGNTSLMSVSLRSIFYRKSGTLGMSGNNVLADELEIGPISSFSIGASSSIQSFAGTSIKLTNLNNYSSGINSTVNLGPNGELINSGIFAQTGTLTVAGSFTNNKTFQISGMHSVGISGDITTAPGSIFNPGNGNIALNILLSGTSQWLNSGVFNTGSTASIQISSSSPGAFVNAPTGVLNLGVNLLFQNFSGGISTIGNFNITTGKIIFGGSGSSTFSAANPISINWLEINKLSGTVSYNGPGSLTILDRLEVLGGTFQLNGNPLVLKSTASNTAHIGVISGVLTGATNVTQQRFVPGTNRGWHFLGTSITNQTFADWNADFQINGPFPGATFNMDADRSTIFSFNGQSAPDGIFPNEVNGWRVPTIGDIEPGKGYRVFLNQNFFSSNKIITNSGTINQGNFNFNVGFNPIGYNGGGWNFLSNPYPSQIDWTSPSWTKTNIGGSIYIWNGQTGQYGVFNQFNNPPGSNPGINGARSIIAPGQAFFVMATGPGAVLQGAESVKSGNPATFIRSAVSSTESFRISLSNEAGYKDENILRFHDKSTMEFDSDADAHKLYGSVLNLWTTTPGGTQLCINTIPGPSKDGIEIPVSFNTIQSGNFKLIFSDFEGNHSELVYLLKDNYLSTHSVIEEGAVYSFQTNAAIPQTTAPARFTILVSERNAFSNPIINDENLESNVFEEAPGSGNLVFFPGRNLNQNSDCEVVISNLQGQAVHSMKIRIAPNQKQILHFGLIKGIYIFHLNQSNVKFNQKVIIR